MNLFILLIDNYKFKKNLKTFKIVIGAYFTVSGSCTAVRASVVPYFSFRNLLQFKLFIILGTVCNLDGDG